MPIIEQVTPAASTDIALHQSSTCASADKLAALRAENAHLKQINGVLLAMQALIDAKAAKRAQVRRDVAMACGVQS